MRVRPFASLARVEEKARIRHFAAERERSLPERREPRKFETRCR
jgi:hypothetical protein